MLSSKQVVGLGFDRPRFRPRAGGPVQISRCSVGPGTVILELVGVSVDNTTAFSDKARVPVIVVSV